ncbi:Ubiquitin carboxyl terminal hydrolase 47 [Fasciola hepatica]|uniref:Ubiquitin carboxyl terminal hydrolase 47 n=1 Tax=Fasciola hepatica TaxID=6192 RepID=A0A4E0R713_FASHE|nr:Ubiquitin carboxyl terminal hydrolase 47 [Fasciola hepatica]
MYDKIDSVDRFFRSTLLTSNHSKASGRRSCLEFSWPYHVHESLMRPRTQNGSNDTEVSSEPPKPSLELPWSRKPRQKLTGLLNQGGTCYLNTLLQTLLHTPEFTYRLFNLTKFGKKEQLKRVSSDRPGKQSYVYVLRQMIQEMLNLFSALITTEGGAISSKPLTDSFGWTEDEVGNLMPFRKYKLNASKVCVHQDIQELNRLLFEQIEIALKGTSETNMINDLYRGVQCTRIRCLRCGRISERNDEFQDINLSVMDHDSVEASLIAHTQLERLTGDNQYFCDACQCKVDAVKITRFEELPPILTLSLSRFYFDAKHMQSVKLEKMCSFPFLLDMSNFFMNKTNKKAKYSLFSIVLHVGGSTGGGHYHAFIKDPYGTVREASKDSASASEFNANNKWPDPTATTSLRTSNSTVDSPDHIIDSKKVLLDSFIPFADGERASIYGDFLCSEPDPTSRRKKIPEGDFHANATQPHARSPRSPPSAKDVKNKVRTNGHKNGKPCASLDRLPSPPSPSNLNTLGKTTDQMINQEPSLGWTNLLSENRVYRLSRTSLCRNDTSNADTMSELVGLLRTNLSIDNTTDMADAVNRNTGQLTSTGNSSKSVVRMKRSAQHSHVRSDTTTQRSRRAIKATDAISVYPVKGLTSSRVVEPRCRSVHVTSYETERKFSPKQNKKKSRENTKGVKPTPFVRQNRTSSFRESLQKASLKGVTKCRRPRKVPSSGLPALQTSQHNSGPRQTTSSMTSPSESPAVGRPFELRTTPSIPAYSSSRSGWRSRLFDGVSVEEIHSSKNTQSNMIHPPLYRGDPQCSSSPVVRQSERTQFSEDSSNLIATGTPYTIQLLHEDHGNLDNIPTIQRVHAKLPSKWSQSCETVTGVSNVSSHTTVPCGEPTKFNSSTDQNKYNQILEGFNPNTEIFEQKTTSKSKNKLIDLSSGVDLIVEQRTEIEGSCEKERLPTNDQQIEHPEPNSTPEIRVSQQTENNTEVVFGRWFDFNDDYIVEVDPTMFSRVFEGPECAYMLFYRCTNLPSPLVTTSR